MLSSKSHKGQPLSAWRGRLTEGADRRSDTVKKVKLDKKIK
jgi:hypothetical protein